MKGQGKQRLIPVPSGGTAQTPVIPAACCCKRWTRASSARCGRPLRWGRGARSSERQGQPWERTGESSCLGSHSLYAAVWPQPGCRPKSSSSCSWRVNAPVSPPRLATVLPLTTTTLMVLSAKLLVRASLGPLESKRAVLAQAVEKQGLPASISLLVNRSRKAGGGGDTGTVCLSAGRVVISSADRPGV